MLPVQCSQLLTIPVSFCFRGSRGIPLRSLCLDAPNTASAPRRQAYARCYMITRHRCQDSELHASVLANIIDLVDRGADQVPSLLERSGCRSRRMHRRADCGISFGKPSLAFRIFLKSSIGFSSINGGQPGARQVKQAAHTGLQHEQHDHRMSRTNEHLVQQDAHGPPINGEAVTCTTHVAHLHQIHTPTRARQSTAYGIRCGT